MIRIVNDFKRDLIYLNNTVIKGLLEDKSYGIHFRVSLNTTM